MVHKLNDSIASFLILKFRSSSSHFIFLIPKSFLFTFALFDFFSLPAINIFWSTHHTLAPYCKMGSSQSYERYDGYQHRRHGSREYFRPSGGYRRPEYDPYYGRRYVEFS